MIRRIALAAAVLAVLATGHDPGLAPPHDRESGSPGTGDRPGHAGDVADPTGDAAGAVEFWLTLLYSNDGESGLLPLHIEGGEALAGPGLTLATVDFLARGGDGYPLDEAPTTRLGVTDRQALKSYVRQALGGEITAGDYPEGGTGRITTR